MYMCMWGCLDKYIRVATWPPQTKIPDSTLGLGCHQGWSQEFLFGGPNCNSNIFIKTTLHTHIHTFFYYIHTFLFDKLYIYTHQTTTKRA